MADDYKEIPFRGHDRPLPWKIKSLPKFTDVPGRKFNGCPKAKTDDGEPPTPPPSPMGTFKYPALFRGSNTWMRDTIVTEFWKSNTDHRTPDPDAKMKLEKAEPQTSQNYLVKIKPASGKTKMYLWPQPKSIDCPKLDLSSLTKDLGSARPSKAPKNKFQDVSKFSGISLPKKTTNFPEAGGDTKKDMGHDENAMMFKPLNNSFGTMSNQDFDVILRHALSHDPILTGKNSTPRIQRNMTFAEKPRNRFSDKKRDF